MKFKFLLAATIFLLSSCHFTEIRPKKDISFDMIYKFSLTGKVSRIKFVPLIPKSIKDRQTVLDISYSTPPSVIYDEGEYKYAEFIFLNPKENFEVRISVKAQLIRHDLSIATKNPVKSGQLIPAKYLATEKYLEKDDQVVLESSKKITGNTEISIVENIYYYVLQNMEYDGDINRDLGAAQALRLKKGHCGGYCNLFVALCRAKQIPARVIEGYCIGPATTPKHSWAEVYIRGHGWVPFDPTFGDFGKASFDRLKPIYIYLTSVRNNKLHDNYHYYAYHYWGDPIEVVHSFLVKQ